MQLHPRIMIAVIIVLVAAPGYAQDAIFQGNEARTGEASELRLQQQPEVLWKFVPESPNGRLGGVLAAGERVFVSDEGGRIYAARASDGQLLWTHQGNKGRSKMPLVMGDIAYFATSTSIVALSVLNGETVWTYDIPQGANETSPLMVANLLLVCGYDGIVYALDA